MIRVAIVGILIEEVLASLLTLLPKLRLFATHPSQTVLTGILHRVSSAIVWLVVIEEWRGSKLQHAALHSHSGSLGPVTRHGRSII